MDRFSDRVPIPCLSRTVPTILSLAQSKAFLIGHVRLSFPITETLSHI